MTPVIVRLGAEADIEDAFHHARSSQSETMAIPQMSADQREEASRFGWLRHSCCSYRAPFYRSLVNLVGLYSSAVDHWRVYDNSLLAIPELILSGEGRRIEIHQDKKWQSLLKLVEKSRE